MWIYFGTKMGNAFSSTMQNMLRFVMNICVYVLGIFLGIAAKFCRRYLREESSPVRNGPRRWQIGHLAEECRQNGICEEPCSEESDVPPPIPPKKNRPRIRRYGVSYNDNERKVLLEELQRQNGRFLNRCVSNTDEKSTRNSSEPQQYENEQVIDNCEKHTVRKLSIPKLHSGGLSAITKKGSDIIVIIDTTPPTLNVPNMCFDTMSNPVMGSGGTVFFGELSKHIAIRNIYTEKPIVYNDLPEDFTPPPISPTKELTITYERKFSRSHSAGGVIEDTSDKVTLPELFSDIQPKVSPPRVHRSLSGGWVTRTQKADHVIFSNPSSMTFKLGHMSGTRNSEQPEGYSESESHIAHNPKENALPENNSGNENSHIKDSPKTEDHSKE